MLKINRYLLYFQALFWFVLASFNFQRFQEWVIPLLLVVDCLVFLLLGLLYPKHRTVKVLALLYLAFNLLLTLTDQMGFWDFAYLALSGLSFILIAVEMGHWRKRGNKI